jgi:hypothetical protein
MQQKLKERGKYNMQQPLEAKAIVMLDGNELTILNRLLIKKSKEATLANNWQEAQQFIIIADKLADAKEEFHKGWNGIMSEKYDLDNKKAAASTATNLNP